MGLDGRILIKSKWGRLGLALLAGLVLAATVSARIGFGFWQEFAQPKAFVITGVTSTDDRVIDAYLAYGNTPTVNFADSLGGVRYDVTIKSEDGNTIVCTLADWSGSPALMSGCNLTSDLNYRIYVTAENLTGALTRDATNNGFLFTVSMPPVSPSEFAITGATGGSDDTVSDSWLTSGNEVTVNWSAALSATSYDVTVRDETDTSDVCATQNTVATSFTFSGCTLSVGTTYRIKVTAKRAAFTREATNNGFAFVVVNGQPSVFLIHGVTASPDDATADANLVGSTTVTANWFAATGATSYDVTIRNATDTADVCATQNTASTAYTFTGCTLTEGTGYLLKVVAIKASGSTVAANWPYYFKVAPSINCASGTRTEEALVIYDSGGSAGNYGNSESCGLSIQPPGSPSTIVLRYREFKSADSSDVLSVYNAATATNLLGSNSNLLAPPSALPSDRSANSGRMFLQWTTNASGVNAGFRLLYHTVYAAIGYFSIEGVKGGSDTTADGALTAVAAPEVTWGLAANAASYRIQIRNLANTHDECSAGSTSSLSYTFTGCSLTEGSQYQVHLYARDNYGKWLQATNSPFTFTFAATKPAAPTITGIGSNGNNSGSVLETTQDPGVFWTKGLGATSYTMSIYEDDGITVACPEVSLAAFYGGYQFTGCKLRQGIYYRIKLAAVNSFGTTLATNNNFRFQVVAWWSPTNLSGSPSARAGHSAIWTGSEMIVWGGGTVHYSTRTFFRDGFRYNPTTDSWMPITGINAPSARAAHTAVWTGSEMIVWGGYEQPGETQLITKFNDGGRYDPVLNSWRSLPTTGAPAPAATHTAVWTGTEMIVWGGSTGDTNGRRYDPVSDAWSAIGTSFPLPRMRQQALWTGSEMIFWGGVGGAGMGSRYNPTTDSWTAITKTGAPSERDYLSAVWTGTEMIVWGGGSIADQSFLATGGRYHPALNSWTPTSTVGAPEGRYLHTAVWTGTEMIVWGGKDRVSYYNTSLQTGARYNPSTDSWVAISSVGAPEGRYLHTAVWTGTEMIIWGGFGPNSVTFGDGRRYDPALDSWVEAGPLVPESLRNARALWTGSEMIVWGGGNGRVLNSGFRYNPVTNSMTGTSLVAAPPARWGHSVVWTGTELIVWGGTTADLNDTSVQFADNTGGRYNPASDSWAPTSAIGAPTSRSEHSAVWTGTEMIVFGGNPLTASGMRYNPASDSWSELVAANFPEARAFHTSVWTGTEMIVWGGTANYDQGAFATGGIFNPVANSWTPTSTQDAPAARYYHSAVWTGSEMIVWGGTQTDAWLNNTQTTFNSGGRFNPLTNSWSPVSLALAPEKRLGHTAVWTGSEMIIWGGHQYSPNNVISVLNSGARYNPASDSWVEMSTYASPSPRTLHTAVWTGTELIVWGGAIPANESEWEMWAAKGSVMGTGGRYNPSTDTWSPTSLIDAPAARAMHTATWTGTEMIVWGGSILQDLSTDLQSGARYDPALDSWLMMGGLEARDYHSAVWTGSEMIIWGGCDAVNWIPCKQTGSVYNPTTDAWASTALLNAPSARGGHTAVWTGSEMIVWGGWGDVEGVRNGGRYNPVSNSWSGVTLTGAAQGMANHTAVWTGSEMIVWGGLNLLGASQATGARYNPALDSWASMATLNAPTARYDYAAVWTGTEVIIWSGTDPFMSNTGARYRPATDSWTTMSTVNAPSARRLAGAVWTGTEMLVWGGNNETTGGRYDPSSDTWLAISDTDAPAVRNRHSVVWSGTEMLVWGGDWNGPTGGRYNPATDTWLATSQTGAPLEREGQVAVWTGSEMIVWGGLGDMNLYVGMASGGRYQPATDSWVMVGSDPPIARERHVAYWTGSEVLIWGGYDVYNGNLLNTGGRYNPAADKWTAVNAVGAPFEVYQPSGVWTGTEMMLWGGIGNNATWLSLDSGGRYTPSTDSWSAIAGSAGALPEPRYNHAAVWTGTEMLIWGGDMAGDRRAGWRYNPTSSVWTAMSIPGFLSSNDRFSANAVWTGSEMIMWGGVSTTRQDGIRYSPSTNSWTATSLTNAPSARSRHSVVWTGSEMIVWGGYQWSSPYYLNSGGRYNPATDTWLAMTTTNTPAARADHAAVWAGSEMISWGGEIATLRLANDIGRYTPSTDSWLTVSPSRPSPRGEHTAVWTGTEMIVWGGQFERGGGGGPASGGARYAPATNSWSAVTATGAPTDRKHHSAVWTGSEMLVWGGDTGTTIGNVLQTGGRYSPATDSWLAMTTVNAPAARCNQSAVWSGTEMIVWGGAHSCGGNGGTVYQVDYYGGSINTGSRYNPTSDSWTAMTLPFTLTPRQNHLAFWTGTEMIIWGGNDGSYLKSGGRYNPVSDSWLAMSATNAPNYTTGPKTGVWTGTEMILAAADSDGVRARYNLATDTWSALSTTNSPSPWLNSSGNAVWTGSEVLVWGQSSSTGNSWGSRYLPATNTWITMSASAQPSTRLSTTAVWTGSQMIIWGGQQNYSDVLKTGGIFSYP